MPYEPFLISSFETGKAIGKKPWMIPPDAWETLTNWRVNKGVLYKRPGYDVLANTVFGHVPEDNLLSGTSMNDLPGDPIMGFWKINGTGSAAQIGGCDFVIVVTTKRAYCFTAGGYTNAYLLDMCVDSGDIFTATDLDYFSFVTQWGKAYMTNGFDDIYAYTPNYQYIPAGGGVIVYGSMAKAAVGITLVAKLLGKYKNRLFVINVKDADGIEPMRLRYSNPVSETFDALSYVDPDWSDYPMTIGYIGEEPFVFCRNSVGRLRYTGNTDAPLALERTGDATCIASFCVEVAGVLYVLGDKGLIRFDGYRHTEVGGGKMRDFVDEISSLIRTTPTYVSDRLGTFGCVQACVSPKQDYLYVSYPVAGETYATRLLEYNLKEDSYSISTIPAHSLFYLDNLNQYLTSIV